MDVLERTINGIIGKIALGVLLSVILGLGKYQLDLDEAKGAQLEQLTQQVADLQVELREKYNDIKAQVKDHYDQVDRQNGMIAETLAGMSETLSAHGVELGKIQVQIAGVQEQAGRVTATSPAASIPIIGPLLFNKRVVRGKRSSHR